MILVDNVNRYGHGPTWNDEWCHMMTDDLAEGGLDELHEMARLLGLKRAWFQNHANHPHYDLTAQGRERALELGAQPVSSRELIRRCSRVKVYK